MMQRIPPPQRVQSSLARLMSTLTTACCWRRNGFTRPPWLPIPSSPRHTLDSSGLASVPATRRLALKPRRRIGVKGAEEAEWFPIHCIFDQRRYSWKSNENRQEAR